ncbi:MULTISPECIES: hypothetical protein [Legionella]|uniref:Uncharacterized protein n=1 Tax=Legionella septentrionalis TaxID=2498109 RepID=A0A3S0VBW4_9GAMM|nr:MULTISPECIES: hypothetical protein [Legionella]MCP0913081.1 hypothetical protein [Legionella sp. 27cVA30]RUQ91531.1 hypothetical protein EKM59_00280 [Legionella septentrionalis]RUQ94995.1 hypothetical protein ELY11_10435 [Legionella septentrionalis]RUR10582.1 hypothetical protein ELY14_04510 [Legionella septentrionalis]RUR13787.1 hypothetical protein ELY10_09925 [Legionella septentrionalis]
MTIAEKNNPLENPLTGEDYAEAMNFIGQNLLSSLAQSIENLPAELRNRQVVFQGLSAFLTNIIYKQSPTNQTFCNEMLDDLAKLIRQQLNEIYQPQPSAFN